MFAPKSALATLLAALLLLPTLALAAPTSSAAPATESADSENFLQANQYHLENARLPGQDSTRQNLTAWQITSGRWNGQSLAGLSIVLIQSVSDDGHSLRQTNCYISHFASPAQREALLSALLSAQPQYFPTSDLSNMRFEPAVITLDPQGDTLTLHLALIA